MKLYTDYTGKYQMFIPTNWEYKNPSLYHEIKEGLPQAFGLYDGFLGVFQISCKPINEHITELIKKRKEPIQSSSSANLLFSEVSLASGDKEVFMFSCAVDDHYFFATYIIPVKYRNQQRYIAELSEVRRALSSIKFIKPEYRNHVAAMRRFDLFMSSIAATIDLQKRAIKNLSFIEYIALSANKIDALLRLSVILKNQILNKNNEIESGLLFQNENDKPILERTIYKLAFEKGIIKKDVFDKLEELYQLRNKVIHRYIITDIRTVDLQDIAIQYSQTDDMVGEIVNNLEREQSESKIGIHGKNSKLEDGYTDIDLKEILTKIRDKHGNIKWESF